MPRPLSIDVHELANPVLVSLADAQGARRRVSELKAPPRIVAEAHHVGDVGWLRRWRCLLLARGSGAVLPEWAVLRKCAQRGTKQSDREKSAHNANCHYGPPGLSDCSRCSGFRQQLFCE